MLQPILAKLSAHPGFADALSFITTGFILVIGALLVLSGLISAIGAAFRKQEAKAKAAMPVPAKATVSSPAPLTAGVKVTDGEIPLPALIAAAVHVALDGQPHRVVHIEPVSVGWAREGRREIFSSHRIR